MGYHVTRRYFRVGAAKAFDEFEKLDMPPNTLVLGGLWYCLRPSLIPTPSARHFRTWKPSERHNLPPVPTASISLPPTEPHPSTGKTGREGVPKSSDVESEPTDLPLDRQDSSQPEEYRDSPRDASATTVDDTWIPRSKNRISKVYRWIISKTKPKQTDFLEGKLERIAGKTHDLKNTMYILHVLVRYRHIRPDVRHYRALILANCDPIHGSADQVRALLGEMEPNGIPLDSATLHAALQVRIVSPASSLSCFENLTYSLNIRLLQFIRIISYARMFCKLSEIVGFP